MVRERRLAYIVEGHGEVGSLPGLVQRIAQRAAPDCLLRHEPPIRSGKGRMVRGTDFERAIERAARKVSPDGAVLVVLDSDDDCPALLGPSLLERARLQRSDVRVAVVVARSEFESWFVAAAESLRGERGLRPDLVAPPNPEAIRDAKGSLSAHMANGGRYVPTVDHRALAGRFDLDLARRAASFDQCYREVTRLLTSEQ